jgi:cysteinyl-tRNA synthetase
MEESIKIYNSLKREKELLKTVTSSQVKMYVCGPTVYDEPHIGHARSAYIFDVIRRYLIYKGYKVNFVRNVTDVDDKIIEKARKEYKDENLNSAVNKVATKYLQAYHQALDKLGITSSGPDILEPKASEYIAKMVKFIEGLIDRGVAYPAGGDVYFDISKVKDYGKLSNQSLDKMEIGVRVTPGENKKSPLDFALWKSAKADEPSWESPWGKGRPGWHIECSVMSSDLLGDEFDIHGGGIDLIFPHHENEIAQSEGAGKKFARIWIHHGLLTINGQKMAKSLGNFVTVDDFLAKFSPDVLKLFFLQAHYSQPVDFTWDKIEEKQKAIYRIINFLKFVKQREEGKESFVKTKLKKIVSSEELHNKVEETRKNFEKDMDDDFNTPNAVAALFELTRTSENVLGDISYKKEHLPFLKYARQTIEELGGILSLSFKEGPLSMPEVDIQNIIKTRNNLKKQKLFKEADQLREDLENKGIVLEDTHDGKTTFRRKL